MKIDQDVIGRELVFWCWQKTPLGEEINVPIPIETMRAALTRYQDERKISGFSMTEKRLHPCTTLITYRTRVLSSWEV